MRLRRLQSLKIHTTPMRNSYSLNQLKVIFEEVPFFIYLVKQNNPPSVNSLPLWLISDALYIIAERVASQAKGITLILVTAYR